jgi:hypothetical protein
MGAMTASVGDNLFPDFSRIHQITLSAALKVAKLTEEDMAGLIIVACAYYGLPSGGLFRYTTVMHEIIAADGGAITTDVGDNATFNSEELSLTTFGGEMT